jgi:hypothetical protein
VQSVIMLGKSGKMKLKAAYRRYDSPQNIADKMWEKHRKKVWRVITGAASRAAGIQKHHLRLDRFLLSGQ